MLTLQSVMTYYGKILALKGVSLHVAEGEIVALIGPNGAGKTTALNTICGIVPARTGCVFFGGKDTTSSAPDRMVSMGLIQVPEGRQLFADMSVYDNLLLGSYRRDRADKRRRLQADLETVYSLFPILRDRTGQLAGTLSGGEQQMLAIGRALMGRPKMMLLDEPSMGLAPLVVKEIFRVIAELAAQGTTILLVEQNARAALAVAHRAYVLETGSVVLEGTADDLANNPEIQRAYLGKGYRQILEEDAAGIRGHGTGHTG